MEQITKKNAIGLYHRLIRDGNPQGAAEFLAADYRQHAAGILSWDFMKRSAKREVDVLRVLRDGPYVFSHVCQRIDGVVEWVTTDFLLFDDDNRITDHWYVIAPLGAGSPSGHTPIDGATEIEDIDVTDANKLVVATMIQQVLIPGGDPGRVGEWIHDDYIQHNPQVPDGLEPFRRLAIDPKKPLLYDQIVLIVGEGNFVATLCRARWESTPYAQVDLFRLANGKIVEHWDCAQKIENYLENS